jgi:beta-mannosidase
MNIHHLYKTTTLFLVLLQSTLYSTPECVGSYSSISLSENWKFRNPDETVWFDASVPGCVHSDLISNKLIEDPYYRTNANNVQWVDTVDWIYETEFDVSDEFLKKENIRMVFGCVDTYADIYLNDSLILSTDNYFLEWKVEVKELLKAGKNKLHVQFYNATREGLKRLENSNHPMKDLPADKVITGALNEKRVNAFTRKPGYQFGWDWDDRFVSVGMREPVIIEAWDTAKIENVQILQDKITDEVARLSTTTEIVVTQSGNAVLEIMDVSNNLKLASQEISLVEGLNKVLSSFEIEDPVLWWTNGLGEAHLYSLAFTVKMQGEVISTRQERIGLRTVRLVREPDSLGTTFYIELNGQPVFMKGANYIPNDNFLNRVTPENYRKTIQSAVDANMNMLRIWGGGFYERDIFYDLCDENGILVWQDFMFGGGIYPAEGRYLESVKEEVRQVARRLRNRPCIALWCGNNETYEALSNWSWDKEFTPEEFEGIWNDYYKLFNSEIPEVLQKHNPTRAYWPSSPISDWDKVSNWEGFEGDIHYWEIWFFDAPFEKVNIRHGRFNSEFGFQSFPKMKTIQEFSNKEDWAIDSEVMKHRQKSYVGNEQIKKYMEMYYKYPSSFENLVYLSQVLQAFGIKTGIQIHRKKMPVCMGSLYWQFNDCWPAISWSSLDYYLRWKALHYFVRDANKPVIIVPEVLEENVNVHVVSDRLEPFAATINLTLMNFSGEKLWEDQLKVQIAANTSEMHFSIPVSELVNQDDRKSTLMLAEVLNEDGVLLDDEALYFVLPKDLELPEPELKISITPDGDNYTITLTSDKLCKNVYLSLQHGEGFFTDNYFDILPGITKTISLKDHNLTSLTSDDIHYITLKEGMN